MTKQSDDKTVMITVFGDSTEMATKNRQPFTAVEDSELRNILDPMPDGAGGTVKINVKKIVRCVNERRSAARLMMSGILRNHLISLKVDCASHVDPAILGVNVHDTEDERLVLRTLGMRELFESQSGEYLKPVISRALSQYRVRNELMYSTTSGNEANMLNLLN